MIDEPGNQEEELTILKCTCGEGGACDICQGKHLIPVEEPKEYTAEVMRAGKLRKIRVKDISIEWEGKPAVVTIKKFSFGERADFTDKFLKVEVIGEIPKTEVSIKAMQIHTLVLGIHKAPFESSEDYIVNELDGELGEQIHQEIDKFNKLTPSTEKKFDGQSSTEQTIPE